MGGGSNLNMSAAAARPSACDEFADSRCPKPRDRCAQPRDHCHHQPAKTERKEKKHRKKFVVHVSVSLLCNKPVVEIGHCVNKILYVGPRTSFRNVSLAASVLPPGE